MGQDPVSDPGPGPCDPVDAGAVHRVAAFERADGSLGAGSPLDQPPERLLAFRFPARGRGSALAWDDHLLHPKVDQLLVDAGLAVAAVRGDRAGDLADPTGSTFDGGHEQVSVGPVTDRRS